MSTAWGYRPETLLASSQIAENQSLVPSIRSVSGSLGAVDTTLSIMTTPMSTAMPTAAWARR